MWGFVMKCLLLIEFWRILRDGGSIVIYGGERDGLLYINLSKFKCSVSKLKHKKFIQNKKRSTAYDFIKQKTNGHYCSLHIFPPAISFNGNLHSAQKAMKLSE